MLRLENFSSTGYSLKVDKSLGSSNQIENVAAVITFP